jgi:hypothetical protein
MSRVYESPYVQDGFKPYKNPYQAAANEWATWDEGEPIDVSIAAAVFIGEGIRLLLPTLKRPIPPPPG